MTATIVNETSADETVPIDDGIQIIEATIVEVTTEPSPQEGIVFLN